jgi:TolB-like protein/Tfp pilus assembly protein PilF
MSPKRELVAILFADVQGFTALVQEDEAKAKAIKDKFQNTTEVHLKKYHARIIRFQGDGVFCLFKSATNAVMSAIEIQQQMLLEPKVPLRIGIHLGDVIIEGKEVFGNGVNIASRVQSFAVPGGIFISDLIYNEIRNNRNVSAVCMGKYKFKNVNDPVEIYAVSNAGLVVPVHNKLSGKGRLLQTKRMWVLRITVIFAAILLLLIYANYFNKTVDDKSVAVIPFINLTNNPAEEYLSEGITEDILTSLSNVSGLKVTSFTSTRQYKGTTKTIKQIASELHVAYILEGSVQHAGDQIRITAQLIKAKDDAHVWAEHFDESFNEILSIQSLVSKKVASALETKLSAVEQKKIENHATLNIEAYQLYLKGRHYWNLRTHDGLDSSIVYFLKAIKSDPEYALAYSGVADSYTILCDNGYTLVDSVALKAKTAIDRALTIDSSLAEVKASYAIYLSSIEGNGSAAINILSAVVEGNPNYASAFQWYAVELSAKGKFETAGEMIDKAIVLDPRSKRIYFTKSLIYLFAREFPKAIKVLKEAPDSFSSDPSYVDFLANLYYLKGNTDSAAYYARQCNDEILLNIFKKDKVALQMAINRKSREDGVTAEDIANFYAKAGSKDSAFAWLTKSVLRKEYGGLKFLAVSPNFDPLRNDRRFDLLLQNSGIR